MSHSSELRCGTQHANSVVAPPSAEAALTPRTPREGEPVASLRGTRPSPGPPLPGRGNHRSFGLSPGRPGASAVFPPRALRRPAPCARGPSGSPRRRGPRGTLTLGRPEVPPERNACVREPPGHRAPSAPPTPPGPAGRRRAVSERGAYVGAEGALSPRDTGPSQGLNAQASVRRFSRGTWVASPHHGPRSLGAAVRLRCWVGRDLARRRGGGAGLSPRLRIRGT